MTDADAFAAVARDLASRSCVPVVPRISVDWPRAVVVTLEGAGLARPLRIELSGLAAMELGAQLAAQGSRLLLTDVGRAHAIAKAQEPAREGAHAP